MKSSCGSALAVFLLLGAFSSRAQWVAFNDHAAGGLTSANASRWNAFNTAGGAPGSSGFLKNIANGTNLLVTLTISTNTGPGTTPAGTQAQPASGTPTYQAFFGFVDFQGTPNPSIEVTGTGVVTYTFANLDTNFTYNFKGTAIRGGAADYTNRWTLVEIVGAAGFFPAHTPNVLTSNSVPALSPTQCAINTGLNNAANQGDYAHFDEIRPGTNGTFSITCRQYTGAVPNGSSAGSRGYGITGIRLEQLAGPVPVSIATQPQNQSAAVDSSATFTVIANGTRPAFQWFKGTNALGGKTNQSLVISPVALSDAGTYLVVVSNSVNSVTSNPVTLSVFYPPVIYTNLGLTNVAWKYFQQGTEPPAVGGLTWKQPGYDDSTWPSGRGLLAVEDNAAIASRTNTVLSLTNGSGARIIAYYFRNQFVLTNSPASVSVVMSNLIDDGAVAYLNGAEVWRFNMPAGAVGPGTLASSASTENAFVWTNLPPNILVRGTNTIAIEVHQNSATSSDVVFGSEIRTVIPPPSTLAITSQPQNLVVMEGTGGAFSAGVSGGQPEFRWYRDGALIPGATDATLSFSYAVGGDQGVYYVTASNVLNVVTSAVATLTVVADTNAPKLLSADYVDSTHVLLVFSEPMFAGSVTNPARFAVTFVNGTKISVSDAALTNGTNVMLTTAPLPAFNLLAWVTNAADASPRTNAAPLLVAPVARMVTLVSFGDDWTFYDPIVAFGDPAEPEPGWAEPGFAFADYWATAPGAFYGGNNESEMPLPVNTLLNQTDAYTSYFRRDFPANFSPLGLQVWLDQVIDDGMVLYWNGSEMLRVRMPLGTVTSDTPAFTNVTGYIPVVTNVPLPAASLGATNVVAVELHQGALYEDKAFALQVRARFESVPGAMLITSGPEDVTVNENATATFSVHGVGARTLQWRINGTNVPGATNSTFSFAALLAMDNRLVSVVLSNGASFLVSTNARLRIVPDLTRPVLLGAVWISNSIVLSFSEPLAPGSALTLGNYTITNSAGAAVPISSATLVNGTNVVLTLASQLAGPCVVVVNNVTDASATANKVAFNSAATVGVDYFIPMTSAWKYLLINTNDTVEQTYFQTNYDDSSWQGPSNALLCVESAVLPFPKNTTLSVTDSNNNYINTFYFRQVFYAPISSTGMTFRVRHVIDDGLLLYLNGKEIFRFNMGSAAVTASMQAAANIGDATLQGPFDVVVTNLISGTNILAAEVHQNGANSADVTFGVELAGSIPSVVIPPTIVDCVSVAWSAPRLNVQPLDATHLRFSWQNPLTNGGPCFDAAIFRLEETAELSATSIWTTVTNASPATVPTTSGTRFYRLRWP